MRKISRGERLSSTLNHRLDFLAPKKEYENAEKKINKVRKESQKLFEREKKMLEKRLGLLPKKSSSTDISPGGQAVVVEKEDTRTPTFPSTEEKARRLTIMAKEFATGTDYSRKQSEERLQAVDSGSQGFDKPTDLLRQMMFLYETTYMMVTETEAILRTTLQQEVAAPVSVLREEMETLEEASDESQGGTLLRLRAKRRASSAKHPKFIAEVKAASTDLGIELASASSITRPGSSRAMRTPSVEAASTGAAYQRGTGKMRSDSLGSRHSQTSLTSDFQGMPGETVKNISLVRILTLGQGLLPKELKALTAVLEEARLTVRTIKSGMDPEKALDKLNKKTFELVELAKPRGANLTISPEELLNCGYLRLSKDNVEILEEAVRQAGFEPGIHSHTDVGKLNFTDLMNMPSTSMTSSSGLKGSPDQSRTLQPMPVYLTRPGSPLNKRRNTRPDEDDLTLQKLSRYQ